jgi:long-chain acyl-CoA synthetase
VTVKHDPSGRSYRPRVRLPDVPSHRQTAVGDTLEVTQTLAGRRLLVVGGTGFVGKVLVSMLLKKFPDIGHVYLMVRARPGLTAHERFRQELWPSPCFDCLREDKTEEEALAWLDARLTPVAGDVTKALAGIDGELLDDLRHVGVDVLLNVAGVVSFTPPIDESFRVNTLGVKNLIDLCRELGPVEDGGKPESAVPLLHTSTCYVAGSQTGIVFENDPRILPFPRADELSPSHWDPERELAEGLAIAEQIRQRANDAQLQSTFREKAMAKLRRQGHPTTGDVLNDAIEKIKKRYVDDELVAAGNERSAHWGWPNCYTYTKAVGEQILAESGIPFTIVRPAVVESAVEFPIKGWNEGINTSAPLIYLALHGHLNYPTKDGHVLDVVPVDDVAAGTLLATAALLNRENEMVYQIGTSDTNPLTMHRLIELTGLYKRRFMRSRNRGNPVMNRLYARVEPMSVSPRTYRLRSAPAIQNVLGTLDKSLELFKGTPLRQVTKPVQDTAKGLARQVRGVDAVMQAFIPFTSELDYRFRGDNMRGLRDRCSPEDKKLIPYAPDALDWRSYWFDAHVKGLRKWVFPHLEARLQKRPRAEEQYSDLVALLDESANREGGRIAFQSLVANDAGDTEVQGVSYREVQKRVFVCAARLADAGVRPGDRVALIARNQVDWAIAFFGVLSCGATVVPMAPNLDGQELSRRMKSSEATFALLDESVDFVEEAACFDLGEFCEPSHKLESVEPPDVLISPDDNAVISFSAGATGLASPVELSHRNLTTILASVAPLFKITRRDTGLSVLPLHHSFELTCGLLLPMMRGARVTYVEELTKEKLAEAFQLAGISAMIGVPQVWEELEEKIAQDLSESGPFAEAAFQAGKVLNQTLGKVLGVNLGRVIFRPIHEKYGGKVRFMVSTGGHLPKRSVDLFRTLGIETQQGYGLNELGSVLAIGDALKGSVAVPGVEIEIHDVADDGVGEIVARGDALWSAPSESQTALDAMGPGGWMRTGDLGRMDKHGRVSVIARHNEVITTRDGQRVFPRPIEEAIGALRTVAEAAVVGVPDGQGGERIAALVIPRQIEGENGDRGKLRPSSSMERKTITLEVERVCRKLDPPVRLQILILEDEPLSRTEDHKVVRPDVLARIVANQALENIDAKEAVVAQEVLAPSEALPVARRSRLEAPGVKKEAGPSQSRFLPAAVKMAARKMLAAGQSEFYSRGLKVAVEGRQHIPANRQTLVASNHSSHLDMGLIKYALGHYGEELVTLAAKDYFFEGKWRRFYFENFTNLRPFDRGDSPRETMREASALLQGGHTVLIFPEGTRTVTGEMGNFRSALTYLALKHDTDILPVYVEGTYRAMPRGAVLPKNRSVGVKIGPPISAKELQAAMNEAGLRMSMACAKGAEVVQRAVEYMREDRLFILEEVLDEVLERKPAREVKHENPLVDLFADLKVRFRADEVQDKMSYYFSLGAGEDAKWTVQIGKDGCVIENSRPDEPADCVMKTDVKMFTKIVKDHYIPQMNEFLDGTVKTNNPDMLMTFVNVFNL